MSNDKLFKKTVKNKTIAENELNLEKIIIESIIENLKIQETHNLGNFGYIKKTSKISDGKSIKNIDFFENDDAKIKIFKDFKKNKEIKIKTEKNKKMIRTFSIPLVILFILALIFIFLKFGLKDLNLKNNNNSNNRKEIRILDNTNDSLVSVDDEKKVRNENTTDFVIYENKKVVKEKIDYENKEVVTNKDKSIIIKTESKNDTNLKEGEFTTENVSIDGKIYDKNLYIIKKGDTLWDIAKKFLKNPFLWPNIHKDNPYIKNPHKIEPNYKLTIYTIKD